MKVATSLPVIVLFIAIASGTCAADDLTFKDHDDVFSYLEIKSFGTISYINSEAIYVDPRITEINTKKYESIIANIDEVRLDFSITIGNLGYEWSDINSELRDEEKETKGMPESMYQVSVSVIGVTGAELAGKKEILFDQPVFVTQGKLQARRYAFNDTEMGYVLAFRDPQVFENYLDFKNGRKINRHVFYNRKICGDLASSIKFSIRSMHYIDQFRHPEIREDLPMTYSYISTALVKDGDSYTYTVRKLFGDAEAAAKEYDRFVSGEAELAEGWSVYLEDDVVVSVREERTLEQLLRNMNEGGANNAR